MRLPFNSIRIVPYRRYRGVENMAIDRYLVDWAVEKQMPVLRFYGWNPWCLSLGRHQCAEDVDIASLEKEGYEMVRRPTGGSAIFHSGELTYSFVMPRQGQMDHHGLYEWLHEHLSGALKKEGYEVELSNRTPGENYLKGGKDVFACFNRKAKSEIHHEGRKVVGSAQKIFREAILQHGSVMLTETHRIILSFLKLGPEQQREQQRILVENSVALTTIKSGEVNPTVIGDSLLSTLSGYTLAVKNLSDRELEAAKIFFNEFLIN